MKLVLLVIYVLVNVLVVSVLVSARGQVDVGRGRDYVEVVEHMVVEAVVGVVALCTPTARAVSGGDRLLLLELEDYEDFVV